MSAGGSSAALRTRVDDADAGRAELDEAVLIQPRRRLG